MLRKTGNRKEYERTLDNMYHCCRFCQHFSNGRCFNNTIKNVSNDVVEDMIYAVSENGVLDEALIETLDSVDRREFLTPILNLLRMYGLSDKRIKETEKSLVTELEHWLHNELKPELEDTIPDFYIGSLIKDSGVPINNPENYCCGEWC